MIAIDENKTVIYEGSGFYGYALSPNPLITQSLIIPQSESPAIAFSAIDSSYPNYIFREDHYDPVTRIRRGRFYKFTGTNQWHVIAHPANLGKYSERQSETYTRQCESYTSTSLWAQFLKVGQPKPIVALGNKDRFTIWRIISIEVNISGEEMVILRERSSFGALPVVDQNRIPEARRKKVLATLDKWLVSRICGDNQVPVTCQAHDIRRFAALLAF